LRRVDGESADSDEDEVQRNSEFEEKKRRVRVRNEVDIDLEELTQKAAQRDNPGLTPQERAELEAEINELQMDVVRNINDLIASGYEIERLYDSMGSYNRTVIYNSESWAPGSIQSPGGGYGAVADRMKVAGGLLLSYIHPSIDRINGDMIATPLFVSVIDIEEETESLILGIIGATNHIQLQHLTPDVLASFAIGEIYSPGKLADFLVTGSGTGKHIHISETVQIGPRLRAFVNPDTHDDVMLPTEAPGRYERRNLVEIPDSSESWEYYSVIREWSSWRAR
jgi:hypothetical protein